jgi:NADH-ubiquinone oxidoreductase chain 5
MMLVVVCGISSLVHLYSTEYMAADPHQSRFMSYLSLFTFFMLLLVTGDNFAQMFLGWEGVGLASYLLINFWFTRLQANKSAIKAMVMNRIGDFGLALGLCSIFFCFRSLDYPVVFGLSTLMAENTFLFLGFDLNALTVITILLFVGAVGKSAQLGLHTWLPDAMEGPTPVSALIHAATMVTAGVFLIIRCSPLFELSPLSLTVVTVFGALTAFFAATTGLVQHDLKKVIAFSTCSQLGYMVFACGVSNYSVSFFHLANHAVFKALLFLSAGSIIHGFCDEQDMRRMGGVIRLFPLTYAMMLVGSLALIGFPFLTGFYSKDVILEVAYARYSMSGVFAHWLGCTSAIFTSFYSFRLLFLAFINESNAFKSYVLNAHEAPIRIAIPLIILAFGSIFVGYVTRDMIIGLGTTFWGNAIFVHPQNLTLIDSEFIPTSVKLIPLFCTGFGAASAFIITGSPSRSVFKIKLLPHVRKIFSFLSKKWYIDQVYNQFVGQMTMAFGYRVPFKLIDKGVIEMLGPFGFSCLVQRVAQIISALQSGFLYHYTFFILGGTALIIILSNSTFFGIFDGRLFALILLYTLFL